MTVNKDKRDEREKIIDKTLLLYVLSDCEKRGIEMDEDKLMSLIFIIQKYGEAHGVELFHYTDWEWKDDSLGTSVKNEKND